MSDDIKATHTPTPWKLWNSYRVLTNSHFMAVARIGQETGHGLQGAEGRDILGTEEDFLFMVRACNSFDALVQALGSLVDAMADQRGWDIPRLLADACYALDLAGGYPDRSGRASP